MAYSIDWVDCELTLSNIWHNIESIDPLHRLELMTMFTHSYYKFYENKISPAILETELRSRNLNVGLIAVDWTKDPYYKKIIEDKTGVILKRKYFHLYFGKKNSLSNIDPDHLAPYVTYVSCRPRGAVIAETLTHSQTMEQNLKKLTEAGDVLIRDNRENFLDESDIKIDQSDLNSQIQSGTKLIKITNLSLQEIFEKTAIENPTAQIRKFHINNRTNLSVLVNGNDIICFVGMVTYTDPNGNITITYQMIPK